MELMTRLQVGHLPNPIFEPHRLTSISPRFAGRLYDVFPGACVSYSFNFTTGPHIALMEQFEGAIALYPRQQLRLILKHMLGVELNP